MGRGHAPRAGEAHRGLRADAGLVGRAAGALLRDPVPRALDPARRAGPVGRPELRLQPRHRPGRDPQQPLRAGRRAHARRCSEGREGPRRGGARQVHLHCATPGCSGGRTTSTTAARPATPTTNSLRGKGMARPPGLFTRYRGIRPALPRRLAMRRAAFRIAIFLAALVAALPARATFHLWAIDEIFSTPTAGSSTSSSRADRGPGVPRRSFADGLRGRQSARDRITVLRDRSRATPRVTGSSSGTASFAALGVVAPDYVVPDGFLAPGGGTITFAEGADIWTTPRCPRTGACRSTATARRPSTTRATSPMRPARSRRPPPPSTCRGCGGVRPRAARRAGA